MKINKRNPYLMSVFISDKDTLAVLDNFLAGFYVSNKVNFKNYFANFKIVRFEAVEKLAEYVLSRKACPNTRLFLGILKCTWNGKERT